MNTTRDLPFYAIAMTFLVWACAPLPPRVVYAYIPAPRPQVDPAALRNLYQQEMIQRETAQSLATGPLTLERCRLLLAAVPSDARDYLTPQERACQERGL